MARDLGRGPWIGVRRAIEMPWGEPADGDLGEGRPGGNHPTTGDGNSGGFLRTASTLKCGVRSCRPKLWPSPARAALLVLLCSCCPVRGTRPDAESRRREVWGWLPGIGSSLLPRQGRGWGEGVPLRSQRGAAWGQQPPPTSRFTRSRDGLPVSLPRWARLRPAWRFTTRPVPTTDRCPLLSQRRTEDQRLVGSATR